MDGDNSSTATATTDCCSSASQQCCDSQEHMTKVKSLLDTALRQRFVTVRIKFLISHVTGVLVWCLCMFDFYLRNKFA